MLKLNIAAETCRKMLTPGIPHLADQIRTTYVLKRKWAPKLDKINRAPKPLKTKNFVYDVVEKTDSKKEPDMQLILTDYVEGIGLKGDLVSVRPFFGRNKLLMPGLAMYASPENLKKLREQEPGAGDVQQERQHSSRFSELTRRELARQVLCVAVNEDNPWTIEKWHIRSAFRRAGFWVPDHAITMGENVISGPDQDLEGKQFLVTVTINNLETTPVRCQIHHWSTELENRTPSVDFFWAKAAVPLFEEEAAIFSQLPAPMFKTKAAKV